MQNRYKCILLVVRRFIRDKVCDVNLEFVMMVFAEVQVGAKSKFLFQIIAYLMGCSITPPFINLEFM